MIQVSENNWMISKALSLMSVSSEVAGKVSAVELVMNITVLQRKTT